MPAKRWYESMNITWQDILAVGIVMAAVAYLASAVGRMLRGRSSGCGTCGSCPSEGEKPTTLVSLDLAGKTGPPLKPRH